MARIDDSAPDLWTTTLPEPEHSGASGEAEPPAEEETEEASGEIAYLAHPKVTEALKDLEECFLTPGGSISLFASKFQDRETVYLHEDLQQWETDHPFDSSKQLELGYYYLYVLQDYPKAVLAYHSALKVFDLDPQTQEDLGKAYFGMGEFKKSKDIYESALDLDSRNAEIRTLHLEASQKYLESLDPGEDAEEIASVQGGMVADRAMLLALNAEAEFKAIDGIKTQLDQANPRSPDEARRLLDRVQLLAQSYGALGSASFADPEDQEFVREVMSSLSGQAFGALAASANESPYEEINRRASLYAGLRYLALGDEKDARENLRSVRSEFPEADEILKTMERDDLRSLNLAALDVWESTVEGHDEYEDQKELIGWLRESIRQGKFASIKEALAETEDPFGQELLANTQSADRGGSEILPHLIEYASTLEPPDETTEILFEDAQKTEDPVPQGSYGVYCLLETSAPQEKFKAWSKAAMQELTREKSFLEKFGKTVFSLLPTNPEELALTMMGMGLAQKLGAMARLAALSRLTKAGIAGKTALRLALGAEILAEGNALFAFNTVHAAAYEPAEALSPEHLALNYGATLLTLGFLKPASAAGKAYGPKFARALGLVEGTDLSKAGERFAWATVHAFGFGALVASGQVNQLVHLAATPPGGFAESLASDFVFYVKYGFAGKLFDHVAGKRIAARAKSLHEESGIVPVPGETLEADVLARQSAARPLANDLLAQNGPWNVLGLPIGQNYAGGVPQGSANAPAPSVPAMMMEVRAFVNTAKAEQWGGNAADYYRADLGTLAFNLRSLEPIYAELYGPRNSSVDYSKVENRAKAQHLLEGLQHAVKETQRLKSSPDYRPEVTEVIPAGPDSEKTAPSSPRANESRPSPETVPEETSGYSDVRSLKFALTELVFQERQAAAQRGTYSPVDFKVIKNGRNEVVAVEIGVADDAQARRIKERLKVDRSNGCVRVGNADLPVNIVIETPK